MTEGADEEMIETIRDYEPVRFSEIVWFCPACDGVLGPLGDSEFDRSRSGEVWWEAPERWGDVPVMICPDGDRRFRITFEALDEPDE